MDGLTKGQIVYADAYASMHRYTQNFRENLTLGFFFGQIFATMCVTTSGFSSFLKDFTTTTFSCQRRVAHFLIHFSGAYLVTGTHTSRADFRIECDAQLVPQMLSGLPSVIV